MASVVAGTRTAGSGACTTDRPTVRLQGPAVVGGRTIPGSVALVAWAGLTGRRSDDRTCIRSTPKSDPPKPTLSTKAIAVGLKHSAAGRGRRLRNRPTDFLACSDRLSRVSGLRAQS